VRQPNLTDTEKIQAYLEARYLNDKYHRNRACKDFTLQLWETFQKHNLQDNDFVEQFTSEQNETHIQRYSEMFFAWYFVSLGYTPTSKDEGPDLCIDHNGQRIWVEIITPELTIPKGNSLAVQNAARAIQYYLAPPAKNLHSIRAKQVPSQQILLRWTAALREKRTKLFGYLEKGIVQPEDPYLIAINSKLLGDRDFTGISQWPNAVEATFAVGPIAMKINRQTHEAISTEPSYRPDVVNHNQSNIPADTFLDSSYKEISGIIATHVGLEVALQPKPPSPLVVVHNPSAVNPLPTHIFGAEKEYVAEAIGEEWEIRDIHATT